MHSSPQNYHYSQDSFDEIIQWKINLFKICIENMGNFFRAYVYLALVVESD